MCWDAFAFSSSFSPCKTSLKTPGKRLNIKLCHNELFTWCIYYANWTIFYSKHCRVGHQIAVPYMYVNTDCKCGKFRWCVFLKNLVTKVAMLIMRSFLPSMSLALCEEFPTDAVQIHARNSGCT